MSGQEPWKGAHFESYTVCSLRSPRRDGAQGAVVQNNVDLMPYFCI